MTPPIRRHVPHRLLGIVEVLLGLFAIWSLGGVLTAIFLFQAELGFGLIPDFLLDELSKAGGNLVAATIIISLNLVRAGGALSPEQSERHPRGFRPWLCAWLLFPAALLLRAQAEMVMRKGAFAPEVFMESSVFWEPQPGMPWFDLGAVGTAALTLIAIPLTLRREFGRWGGALVALAVWLRFLVWDPVYDDPFAPSFSMLDFSLLRVEVVTPLVLLLMPRRGGRRELLVAAFVLSMPVLWQGPPMLFLVLGTLLLGVASLVRGGVEEKEEGGEELEDESTEPSSLRGPGRCLRPAHLVLVLIAAALPFLLVTLVQGDLPWIAWIGPLFGFWLAFAIDARFGHRWDRDAQESEASL